MSNIDETSCCCGEESDGYVNEPVMKFAADLTAIVSEARDSDTDFGEVDFDASISRHLKELDGEISALLAERDQRILNVESELESQKHKAKRDISELKRQRDSDRTNLPTNAKIDFAKRILPVADAVERAIESVSEADEAIVSGINAIGRALAEALRSQGIVKKEAIDETFDTGFHESLGSVESAECAADTVVEVSLNGYVDETTGKVVRHAQVVISRLPADADTDDLQSAGLNGNED